MKKITVLSSDKSFIEEMKKRVDGFNHFVDSISLLTFALLNRPDIIILDTSDLPYMNENKIIKCLNETIPQSKIMVLLRNTDDIEFLKMLRKNNNIFYSFNYPSEFLQICEVIENMVKDDQKVGLEYE
ncbi:MAG: hypothetical protein ABIN00_06815 [candidate division WOR-3 bacterium]